MPCKDKEKAKEYDRKYRQNNKEKRAQTQRNYLVTHRGEINKANRERHYKLKVEVFQHYGGGKLACVTCNESRLPCLSIDHINGGGNKHKKEIKRSGGWGFYAWLKAREFPEGYQLLCMNCQFMKRKRSSENL